MEKRKRFDEEEEVDGKKVKGSRPEAENGKKTAETVAAKGVDGSDDDGEVEEFFSILRNIHVAVKYFKEVNGGDRKKLMGTPWYPNFEREDFEAVKGVKSQETVEDNVGLDLNAEPDLDSDPDLAAV